MSNKLYLQNKRRLENKAKHTAKRKQIRKESRRKTFLDKKFPKCEICSLRCKEGTKCPNHPQQEQEVQETKDDGQILPLS